MTNFVSHALMRKDLMSTFSECGISDGLIPKESKSGFVFYNTLERTGKIGNYIVYEILSSTSHIEADNKTNSRLVFAQIDIFSKSSFESKFLQSTVNKLENALVQKGMIVEIPFENFEEDTKLFDYVMTVNKMYSLSKDKNNIIRN